MNSDFSKRARVERRTYFASSSERLDKFLTAEGGSREGWKRKIKEGYVKVNGLSASPSLMLKEGDVIEWQDPPAPSPSEYPSSLPLTVPILYEDHDLIVLDKPPGIVTHPAPGITGQTLVAMLLSHTSLAPTGLPYRPGVVHRLDRDTSGAIVFAKNDASYLSLIAQFRERTVKKEYLAIVKGAFPTDLPEVRLRLDHREDRHTEMRVAFSQGKLAITRFRILHKGSNHTLLSVEPVTGRTHQIRITLSFLGFPVIGDILYGMPDDKISRQALHAVRLEFLHPMKKTPLLSFSPLPSDMRSLLEILGIPIPFSSAEEGK